MSLTPIPIGYVPLLDAAPLIVAQDLGFAAEEGIALELRRAPSWSSLRDMLSYGQVDAAHMLAPVPVAQALGLGGPDIPLVAPCILSVNGTVIGVAAALSRKMAAHEGGLDLADPYAVSDRLRRIRPAPLRVGIPFPFSMHAELIRYWLSSTGWSLDDEVTLVTIPPPMMADALLNGEIDMFCVGEPWGSHAVAMQAGALILPGAAIWQNAPEKVLAVREDWAGAEAFLLHRLIRSVWRAGRWLSEAGNLSIAAEILSRPDYLGLDPVALEMSFMGRLSTQAEGVERVTPRFMRFHEGGVNFPWRSQAQWIAARLAERFQLDDDWAQRRAYGVFRPDIYRRAVQDLAPDLPGASQKLEGALEVDTAVASARGCVILSADRFFDGRIFEPRQG